MTENLLIGIGALLALTAALQIAHLISSRSLRWHTTVVVSQLRERLEALPAEMRQDNSAGRQELAQSLFAALN